MGRRGRHSAKTGNGGAEIRLQKRNSREDKRNKSKVEDALEFYDDPSDNSSDGENQEGSDDSEFDDSMENGEILAIGSSGGSEDEDTDDDDDENENEDEDESETFSDDGFDNDEDFDIERKKVLEMEGKWGKSKKNFYSADTADYEIESDEEAAKDEEDAAVEIQKREAELMDEGDFAYNEEDDQELAEQGTDVDEIPDDKMAGREPIEEVIKNFSKLSKSEITEIINQYSPELLGIISELEATVKNYQEKILPAIEKLKKIHAAIGGCETGLQYLECKQKLMLNYCANISFYLLLKSENKSSPDHPVLQHLVLLKSQIKKLEQADEELEPQFQTLMAKELSSDFEDEDDGMDQFFDSNVVQQKSPKQTVTHENLSQRVKKKRDLKSAITAEELEQAKKFYEEACRSKERLKDAKKEFYSHEKHTLSSSESEMEEDGKRGASYQIMKNRGLTAHKNKLNRNPRVKKRLQYRKAVIRRKGQVREIRVGEAGYYGGESTGIKSNLTRSRKIRN